MGISAFMVLGWYNCVAFCVASLMLITLLDTPMGRLHLLRRYYDLPIGEGPLDSHCEYPQLRLGMFVAL
jgi:hypothetical protein